MEHKFQQFKVKLEQFNSDLCQLIEKNRLAKPKPTEYLFDKVEGYKPSQNSLQAAYNLWAVLSFTFFTSKTWTFSGENSLVYNKENVKQNLFDAASCLQKGEIVTDQLTYQLATICQEFFSNPSSIEKDVKGYLTWGLGGDSVKIFEILSHLFDLAKRCYTLQKLQEQITCLQEKINSGVLPEAIEINSLYQNAWALLPTNEKMVSDNFSGDIQAFSQYCQAQSAEYINSIQKLDATCFEGTQLSSEKFLSQRESCITAINHITAQLKTLADKANELAIQQKKLAEPPLTTSDPIPANPLPSAISPLPEPNATTTLLPNVLALQEQLTTVNIELLLLETDLQELVDEQIKLEKNNFLKEQQQRLATLKTEIEQNLLTGNIRKQKEIQTKLQEKQANLQCDLQKAREKELSNARQVFAAALISAMAVAYQDRKKAALENLPAARNTDVPESTRVISEQNISANPQENSQARTLLEIKKQTLDDAEQRFDNLSDPQNHASLLVILLALFAYLKALVDYHTEEMDAKISVIKASLKRFKDEMKAAVNKPLTVVPNIFKPEVALPPSDQQQYRNTKLQSISRSIG